MRDFRDYIFALLKSWEGLVTGGVLAVALTLWQVFTSKTVPTLVIVVGASAYVLVAGYLVWLKERRRAERAEIPPFTEEIAAYVKSKIDPLDQGELLILKDFAMGAELTAIHAAEPHHQHPTRVGVIIAKTGLIAQVTGTTYKVHAEFQAAIQKYFCDNPIDMTVLPPPPMPILPRGANRIHD